MKVYIDVHIRFDSARSLMESTSDFGLCCICSISLIWPRFYFISFISALFICCSRTSIRPFFFYFSATCYFRKFCVSLFISFIFFCNRSSSSFHRSRSFFHMTACSLKCALSSIYLFFFSSSCLANVAFIFSLFL